MMLNILSIVLGFIVALVLLILGIVFKLVVSNIFGITCFVIAVILCTAIVREVLKSKKKAP